MTVPTVLVSLLRPRVEPSAYEWLHASVAETTSPFDSRVFRAAWARVGRRLGSQPIEPSPDEAAMLRGVGIWPFAGWGADECGRAALLVQAMTVAEPKVHGPLLDSLYLRGTIRERQALLRSLAFLPEPDRFADVAVQACRSHVVAVFEALAVANPYPVRHLARPHFDQMVLKAIALRVGPERIVGLAERLSPDLARVRAPGQRATVDAPRRALTGT